MFAEDIQLHWARFLIVPPARRPHGAVPPAQLPTGEARSSSPSRCATHRQQHPRARGREGECQWETAMPAGACRARRSLVVGVAVTASRRAARAVRSRLTRHRRRGPVGTARGDAEDAGRAPRWQPCTSCTGSQRRTSIALIRAHTEPAICARRRRASAAERSAAARVPRERILEPRALHLPRAGTRCGEF